MSQTYHPYEPHVSFFGAQMLAEAHTLAARTRSDGARGGVAWASAWKPGAVGIGYRIWERSERMLAAAGAAAAAAGPAFCWRMFNRVQSKMKSY